MREIKFRAWHSAHGYSIPFGIGGHPEWNNGLTVSYFAQVCQFEQFTGLLDKNGKEIYENDIVYSENWRPSQMEVTFDRGGFCLKYDDAGYYPDIKYAEKMEVIGNIHENSELLGDK